MITWPFIFAVLKGEKLLLKQSAIRINVVPPRIKHLQVKEIWLMLKQDADLFKYFPNQCLESDPPRHFFFAILATVREDILMELLGRAENAFSIKQAEHNNQVQLSESIHRELNGIQWKFCLLNNKPDKRISFGPRNDH